MATQRPNLLLATLPADEYDHIVSFLEPVTFVLGESIYESGAHLKHIYFPTTSIVSLLYMTESGASAEIGIVGNEGAVGIGLFMGVTLPQTAPSCKARAMR